MDEPDLQMVEPVEAVSCSVPLLLQNASLFFRPATTERYCPASPEKEDPSATAATSALYSAGPVVSDLHLI